MIRKRLLMEAQAWWAAWSKSEAALMAAAIAFYAALSIVPLMLFLLSVVGGFFEFTSAGSDARAEVLAVVSRQLSPEVGNALDRVLAGLQASATSKGPVAFGGFLLSASLVFHQIDMAFSRIWDHHPAPAPGRKKWLRKMRILLLARLRALALLFALVILVVVVFVGGLVMRGLSEVIHRVLPQMESFSFAGTLVIGLGLNFVVFLLLYRFLSKKRVTWRSCAIGAIVAASCWEAGSRLLVELSVGRNYSAYGIVGALLVVQLWIHYNAMILLGGAVLVKTLNEPQSDSAIKDAESRKSG
ncbi:YihY family inner membrane protein [Haloferula luteola]|uniref:YihY family inner membrane protein n=1 Tax=Haloferula luteola TaxID=595692 RepID=A0A840VD81_9BACT|nr:YihY/virulence factor BrkB family protein [Haloferula luteola]MBB5351850.1 YihY family inner membrane protein [Haloferula luteola]